MTNDALEAKNAAIIAYNDEVVKRGDRTEALMAAIAAYHAALPPGDEAGLVKRNRYHAQAAGEALEIMYAMKAPDEVDIRRQENLVKLFNANADALEAKDATIARLQGEVERLTEECSALSADQCGAGYAGEYGHHMCGLVDAEKERADKAEKLLADVRYFSRRWSGCKAVADYIDEQAALPESAPKALESGEKETK